MSKSGNGSSNLTADQMRGRVRVLIDGEEKILRYDQGALVSLIESLELEGLASLPVALSVLDASVLSVLVWAGCLHDSPDLKKEDTSNWFYPLIPTYLSCLEGVNLALWGHPDGESEKEEDKDDADPTKKGTEIAIQDGTSEGQRGMH